MKANFGPHYTVKDIDGKLRAVPDTAALEPDFTIYTGAMQTDANNPMVVRMVGSSTETDLQGDVMTLSALGDMARVQPGLAIWLNHDYTLPHSLFGSLAASPRIVQQNGVADLQLAVEVEPDSEHAMKTLAYIQRGKVRLGCSIGCKVLKYEFMDDSDPNDLFAMMMSPMRILSVQTLEWSVVGVPANQRSWVENAAVGVFQRTLDPRLAPSVKSLFPREYERIVARIEDRDQREELANIPARPLPTKKLAWKPDKNVFVMQGRSESDDQLVAREQLPTILEEEQANFMKVKQMADDLTQKGASGKSSWPLADRDVAWDNGEATQAIEKWAAGADGKLDAAKLASVHFWKDSSADGSLIGSYKLLFCDVIGGDVKAVPKGIFACAAAMQGSHGNKPDIDDQDGVRSKIASYYHKMAKEFKDPTIVPPWEQESGKNGVPDKSAEAGGNAGESTGAGAGELAETSTFVETPSPVASSKSTSPTDSSPSSADTPPPASTPAANTTPAGAPSSETPASYTASAPVASPSSETPPVDAPRAGADSQPASAQPPDAKSASAPETPSSEQAPSRDKSADGAPPEAQIDPVRASMLRSYNDIGKLLGFNEVDITGKRKDAGGVDITGMDMESVIRFAHRLDDIADINAGLTDDLLHALGQPDSDDLAGGDDNDDSDAGSMPKFSSASDFSLLLRGWRILKSGARHSKADMDSLQAIHDSVMALTDGAVCKAAKPDNEDSQDDADEHDNQDDSDHQQPMMGTMSTLPSLVKEIGELRTVFGNINLKAFEADVQKSVDKLAQIEQTLEARRLEAEQIAEQAKQAKLDAIKAATYADEAKQSIDKLNNMPLGRPSGHIGRRMVADPSAVQFNEMLQLAAKPDVVEADKPTLKDALEQTTKTYVAGVGHCRLWPDGVGKGIRPKLSNEQKIIMTPAEITAYNEGGEALVPMID